MLRLYFLNHTLTLIYSDPAVATVLQELPFERCRPVESSSTFDLTYKWIMTWSTSILTRDIIREFCALEKKIVFVCRWKFINRSNFNNDNRSQIDLWRWTKLTYKSYDQIKNLSWIWFLFLNLLLLVYYRSMVEDRWYNRILLNEYLL